MSSIVLKIPYESQSFHAALTDATLRDRVLEWMAAAVTLDDAAYIPLRTDWMPPRDRRTADGVEVLIGGRWPPEVNAESGPRISGAVFGRVWEIVCDADISPDFSGIVTCGLYEENNEQSENNEQNEAPEMAPEPVSDEYVLADVSMETERPAPDRPAEDIHPARQVDTVVPGDRGSIIPDADIDTLEPGSAEFTRTMKRLEHYGAKFPPWFCEQPVEVVRAGLKEAARSERVLRAYAAEREGIQRQRDALVAQWAIDVGVPLPDPEPAIGLEYPCTDDGNGDRLVAQYRDSIRYCRTFDAWFIWDGVRWERDETCRMLALAKRVARTIHIEASATTDDRREKVGKWALSSGMLSRLKAMIACACPAVAVTPDEFDARPELLNCRNGTLELDTLTFREARREDLLTKCCGVDYDPASTCPGWLDHLQTIFAGDAEIVEGFQQMCGYSLLGSNPEEVMFILWGRGKNGKSVTVKALAHVLGDYAVSLGAESLMVQRGGGARPDLAKLKGVRMAAASEVNEGAKLAENIVKQYTSSNDTVSVRRLYENEFEFTPTAKIWLATNHEPQIRGTDDGIWRRIWMLPFTVQISEERRDPNMIDKLTAEAAGILNWMIEGLRKYHANGSRLTPPARVVAATRQYRMESDSLGRAIDEELVCGDAARGRIIARKELTNSLRQWFAEQDEKMPGPRMVAKALRERGVADGPVQGGVRYWIHARWKTDEEQEDDGIGR